jgi:hypothetical protein
MSEQRQIGEISNDHSELEVFTRGEAKYWQINGDNGGSEEIPQYLYDTLNRFQDEQEAKGE